MVLRSKPRDIVEVQPLLISSWCSWSSWGPALLGSVGSPSPALKHSLHCTSYINTVLYLSMMNCFNNWFYLKGKRIIKWKNVAQWQASLFQWVAVNKALFLQIINADKWFMKKNISKNSLETVCLPQSNETHRIQIFLNNFFDGDKHLGKTQGCSKSILSSMLKSPLWWCSSDHAVWFWELSQSVTCKVTTLLLYYLSEACF